MLSMLLKPQYSATYPFGITNTPQAQAINGDSGLNQRTRCSRRISARTARDSDDDDDVQVTYFSYTLQEESLQNLFDHLQNLHSVSHSLSVSA